MSKTGFGFMLVGGIVLALVSGFFVACGSMTPPNNSWDTFYDLVKYAGIAGVLAGVGLFFYGAKGFAAAKP